MIVWGVFVSTIDNFIKPFLIGFGIHMPISLTILGVFGGFIVFGFLGLFIGPTLIAIMFTLLTAWRAAVANHPDVRPASGQPSVGRRGLRPEARSLQ
jgi:predicted PurR-regulated permease PerM